MSTRGPSPTALITFAVRHRRDPGLGRLYREALLLFGIDIPPKVEIGADLALRHRGYGVTLSPFVTIGNRVQLYPRVTIGRSDIYRPGRLAHVTVEDDCVLGVGAVVLAGSQPRILAQGTVLGANSVLVRDTGPWEIWAGNPALQVGDRDPATAINATTSHCSGDDRADVSSIQPHRSAAAPTRHLQRG